MKKINNIIFIVALVISGCNNKNEYDEKFYEYKSTKTSILFITSNAPNLLFTSFILIIGSDMLIFQFYILFLNYNYIYSLHNK